MDGIKVSQSATQVNSIPKHRQWSQEPCLTSQWGYVCSKSKARHAILGVHRATTGPNREGILPPPWGGWGEEPEPASSVGSAGKTVEIRGHCPFEAKTLQKKEKRKRKKSKKGTQNQPRK